MKVAVVMMKAGVRSETPYLYMRQVDPVWVELGFVEHQKQAGGVQGKVVAGITSNVRPA